MGYDFFPKFVGYDIFIRKSVGVLNHRLTRFWQVSLPHRHDSLKNCPHRLRYRIMPKSTGKILYLICGLDSLPKKIEVTNRAYEVKIHVTVVKEWPKFTGKSPGQPGKGAPTFFTPVVGGQ